jgi:hypothetical protein
MIENLKYACLISSTTKMSLFDRRSTKEKGTVRQRMEEDKKNRLKKTFSFRKKDSSSSLITEFNEEGAVSPRKTAVPLGPLGSVPPLSLSYFVAFVLLRFCAPTKPTWGLLRSRQHRQREGDSALGSRRRARVRPLPSLPNMLIAALQAAMPV